MTMDNRPGKSSRYLDYLPAIFQSDIQDNQPNFLGSFLLAFEHVLTGLGDATDSGLEEMVEGINAPVKGTSLAGIQRYFDPGPGKSDNQRAPVEFLDWLSSWVALSLPADLDEIRQRELIGQAVKLYHQRGTRRGLEEMIQIYTRLPPHVDELNRPFQIGVHSQIGVDTILDGGGRHFFKVTIQLPAPNPEELARQRQLVSAIIDMEKPAHTCYTLEVITPVLQIGVYSTVGVDTLLGLTP